MWNLKDNIFILLSVFLCLGAFAFTLWLGSPGFHLISDTHSNLATKTDGWYPVFVSYVLRFLYFAFGKHLYYMFLLNIVPFYLGILFLMLGFYARFRSYWAILPFFITFIGNIYFQNFVQYTNFSLAMLLFCGYSAVLFMILAKPQNKMIKISLWIFIFIILLFALLWRHNAIFSVFPICFLFAYIVLKKKNLGLSLRGEAIHNTESNFERSEDAARSAINATQSQTLKSVVGGLGDKKGDKGSDFAIQAPLSPFDKNNRNEVAEQFKKSENEAEQKIDSNKNENLNLSLRGEAEAIHNTESKNIKSKIMDCHDSAFAESRNDSNTESQINNKTLNKIYNFLFLHNLNKWRSPKKCDKFHSLGLQGIVGKWGSPLKMKGDFKGGTLPPLYNTHEVQISGKTEQNRDSSDFDKNRNENNLHEVQQPLKASSEERVRVVREGEENDFAFVRSTNPHLQIQVSSPSLKIKSIENPCEKDSNKNKNLESRIFNKLYAKYIIGYAIITLTIAISLPKALTTSDYSRPTTHIFLHQIAAACVPANDATCFKDEWYEWSFYNVGQRYTFDDVKKLYEKYPLNSDPFNADWSEFYKERTFINVEKLEGLKSAWIKAIVKYPLNFLAHEWRFIKAMWVQEPDIKWIFNPQEIQARVPENTGWLASGFPKDEYSITFTPTQEKIYTFLYNHKILLNHIWGVACGGILMIITAFILLRRKNLRNPLLVFSFSASFASFWSAFFIAIFCPLASEPRYMSPILPLSIVALLGFIAFLLDLKTQKNINLRKF